MILNGKTNIEIAEKLDIKIPTAKYHVSNILVKLDVKNRIEIFAKISE